MSEINQKKSEYWALPGAASVYHKAVYSDLGSVKVKNIVELAIVTDAVEGRVLDAGTGTGRFAIPLAYNDKNYVVALDYSKEMLELNESISKDLDLKNIEYIHGSVEDLPFSDNEFDSVVSITVVRHFPQWEKVLQEYIRVLKPGGTLVFEMCSADHYAFVSRFSKKRIEAAVEQDFFSYESKVKQRDLEDWLKKNGMIITKKYTYDYLNNNQILRLITLNDFIYRVLMGVLNRILKLNFLAKLFAKLELSILSKLPPKFSYNYMIVAVKG